MSYKDKYGGVHLYSFPSPTQSENGPLFTGMWVVGKYKQRTLNLEDVATFTSYLRGLNRDGKWYPNPETDNADMSHDNFLGVICALKVLEEWLERIVHMLADDLNFEYLKDIAAQETLNVAALKEALPLFHKQLDHPRDFLFMLRFKYRLMGGLANFLLPVVPLAMILTCLQSYKVRGGRKILKTDGKLLAWLRMSTYHYPITKWICRKLLAWNDDFKNFNNCAAIYFKDAKHPLRELIR